MSDDGVRIGLELHQQLDTDTKLFCQCPTRLRDANDAAGRIHRTLHPTTSELGEIDEAAAAEAQTGTDVTYLRYDTTCLVEEDEEPPHRLNMNALDIALEIAAAFDMWVVDQLRVMRKIIIDGSMPSGFQRTALVASDGTADTPVGPVPIKDLLLEEESGRRVETDSDRATFSLGRLGIPLIEVGTEPVMSSPEEARAVAEHLGMVFRSTGRVRRGVGTVRQDVNVSIPEGARVEIKGVQEIDMIEPVIENEVERQQTLVSISNDLSQRETGVGDMRNITEAVEDTGAAVVDEILGEDEVMLAVPLRGFDGVLGTQLAEETFGAELATHARQHGVDGILHTDELQSSSELYEAIEAELALEDDDAACLVAGNEDEATAALTAVLDRLDKASEGVPNETRRANPDGTTTYLRPLGGAARMYPETDVPPVEPEPHSDGPELLEERAVRYETQHGLSAELASAIAFNERMPLYESLVAEDDIDPTLAARTLTQTLRELERDGIPVDTLSQSRLRAALRRARDDEIATDSLDVLIREAVTTEDTLDDIIEREGLQPMTDDELRAIVDEVVEENKQLIADRGMDAVGPLMGDSMQSVGGRADGAVVRSLLVEAVEEQLEE